MKDINKDIQAISKEYGLLAVKGPNNYLYSYIFLSSDLKFLVTIELSCKVGNGDMQSAELCKEILEKLNQVFENKNYHMAKNSFSVINGNAYRMTYIPDDDFGAQV